MARAYTRDLMAGKRTGFTPDQLLGLIQVHYLGYLAETKAQEKGE